MAEAIVIKWRQPETGRLLRMPIDWSSLVLWDRLLSHGRTDDPVWADIRAQLGTKPRNDTVARRVRLLALGRLAGAAMRRGVAGDAAECGCAAGISTAILAGALARGGFAGRLHVFDSFQGLSEPGEADLVPPELNASADKKAPGRGSFAMPIDSVRQRLAGFPFVDFHPGWIPERFPDVAERRFAFVNVDVDLYQPTRDALEFFWPRLNPGGVICVDDYLIADWPGATRAVDELVASLPEPPAFVVPTALGGVLLQKGL